MRFLIVSKNESLLFQIHTEKEMFTILHTYSSNFVFFYIQLQH